MSWVRYGEQLTSRVLGSPTNMPVAILEWNPRTGTLDARTAQGGRAQTVLPDGSVSDTDGGFRTTLRPNPDGSFESTSEKLVDGRWSFFMRTIFVERTPANIARYAPR